jgi:hypothetical protein
MITWCIDLLGALLFAKWMPRGSFYIPNWATSRCPFPCEDLNFLLFVVWFLLWSSRPLRAFDRLAHRTRHEGPKSRRAWGQRLVWGHSSPEATVCSRPRFSRGSHDSLEGVTGDYPTWGHLGWPPGEAQTEPKFSNSSPLDFNTWEDILVTYKNTLRV